MTTKPVENYILHLLDYLLQLRLVEDFETLLALDLSQLDIVVIKLLFHDLLQYP